MATTDIKELKPLLMAFDAELFRLHASDVEDARRLNAALLYITTIDFYVYPHSCQHIANIISKNQPVWSAMRTSFVP